MIRSEEDLRALRKRLEQLAEAESLYKERFVFYGRVMELLFAARSEERPGAHPPSEADARVRLEAGFPLLDRARLEPSAGALEGIGELYDLVTRELGLPPEVCAPVRARLDDRPALEAALGRYLREEPAGDDESGWSNQTLELWQFLAHTALQPGEAAFAEAAESLPALKDWSEGRCPVCGGAPALSALMGEEGRRVLLCHRCTHQWPFPRVRCAHCGIADHEQLRYFQVEGDELYRVDVCNSCRTALKGVDTRSLGESVVLEAEDLGSPHFDLLIEKEGYEKRTPNILGLRR